MAPTGNSLPGSPHDRTKPFHLRSIRTDSSKFHRNTQYIKSESTYNSDEESDKHTPSVVPRPAGQLLFSSLHPFQNPPEALHSGPNPQCCACHTEQEQMQTHTSTFLLPLLAAPHRHPNKHRPQGGGESRAGKERTAAKLLGHAGLGLAI